MDFDINWKQQIKKEGQIIADIADRITDRLDRDDSPNKDVADKKFDKQDEIFEALGISKKDNTKKTEFTFGKTVYEKIKNRITYMIFTARSENDFTVVNEFLKKFNININIEKFINSALLHQQEDEEHFGCTHMQNPDNPLNGHHDCK